MASALQRSEFARFCLSNIVLRTSPHKHRVCAMLFPRSPLKFVRLRLSCYVMCTSPHKHRVCAVLFPRFPFEFARLCVSFCYANFASQTSGLRSACTSVPFGISHACVFTFCVLRLANTGFVQCFSLRPLLSLYACVCHVLLCVLCLTNIGFVQCFSLGSLLSLYAYVSRSVALCSRFVRFGIICTRRETYIWSRISCLVCTKLSSSLNGL